MSVAHKRDREGDSDNGPSPKRFKGESSEEKDVDNNEKQITEAIHIQNLRRPFAIPELKEKLANFGEIVYFWISSNRSQSYVVYETEEISAKALADLDGVVWPEFGDKLSVKHCPKDFAMNSTNEFYLTHSNKATKNLDELFYKTKTEPQIYWCQNEATHKRDFTKHRNAIKTATVSP